MVRPDYDDSGGNMRARALTAERCGLTRGLCAAAVALSVLAAISLSAETARGGELSDIPGAFADVGIGASAMGMGGAVAASIEGASSLFWNPAGLGQAGSSRELMVAYGDQMGIVPYSAGAGLRQLGDYTLGVGLLYSGDDVLSETSVLIGAAREFKVLPWAPEPPTSARRLGRDGPRMETTRARENRSPVAHWASDSMSAR